MDRDSILIVGAGPTGLTAALSLALRGIKPRIIDKRQEPITTSNALIIQPRTLEVWEDLKVVNDALQQGHRLFGAEISTRHKIIFNLTYKDLPTRYPLMLALPQCKTEQLLTEHLSSLGIAIERGVALEKLHETENGLACVCNGETSHYRWVLGCDGIKSTVRQSANIPFEGEDLPQHFIMADIAVDWAKNKNTIHITLAEEGPFAFFPKDNEGSGRLIFDVSNDERLKYETNPTFDDFKMLMKKRCNVTATLQEPNWISTFWIHSHMATTYRKGGLFLAGDAAHQHSPFGGQGMNTGIQDAYFLAHLLADIIEGKKPSQELEEYEKVRKTIGEHVVRQSTRMTKMITNPSKLLKLLRNILIALCAKIPFFKQKAAMQLSQLVFR